MYFMKSRAAKYIQFIVKYYYRLSAHLLTIKKDRLTQTPREPRESRLCNLWHLNVEDEYHFILKCILYLLIWKIIY